MKRPAMLLPLLLTLLNSMGQSSPHAGKGFDFASALAPLRATMAKSAPGHPDTTTLDACYQIADIYNIRSRSSGDAHDTSYIDSSNRYAQLLVDAAHQLGRQDFEGAGYTILAQNLISIHADERSILGSYLSALTLFETWLRRHPIPNDLILERESLAFTNIGFTYFLNKEYPEALRYCDSGIHHAYPAFTAGLPITYKARIYMAQKKFPEAEATLRKALAVMSVQPMVLRWEAMDYLAGLLIQQDQPDSALAILREALAGDKRGYHVNYHYYWLGKAYIALNRPDSALKYGRLELALGESRASGTDRLRAYELLYKTDSLRNQQTAELTYYRQWVNLQDSMTADQSGKDIAEIQHRYDYQAVREAAERQQFQSEQQHQRETRIFLVIFLGLLTVTAAILAYYGVKLRRKNAELRRKNQEILDAHFKGQHFERKRVASELHDNLSSLLAATKLSIQVLDPSALPPGEQKLFQSVLDMMDKACNEVRFIAHDMMPVNLERQGLAAALDSLVAKLNQTGMIRFDLTNIDPAIVLDKVAAFNVYSICLECCNNILRHSKATRAAIIFQANAGELHLLISDNGKGIPDTKKDGMGIRNVNARIEALQGSLEVATSAEGTSFWFAIPLTARKPVVR